MKQVVQNDKVLNTFLNIGIVLGGESLRSYESIFENKTTAIKVVKQEDSKYSTVRGRRGATSF